MKGRPFVWGKEQQDSFGEIKCRLITETIFEFKDKLLPVYNMVSPGLKKMLFYIVLKHLKVYGKMLCHIIFLTLNFIKPLFKADVVPQCYIGRCYAWQMLFAI